ncbi:acyl-CoA--sterol O-acyltransferase 1-like [Lycium barbarum]|uniref:acyl-CoA--sterol O-acyltransferase 1-like n=1 Tax=Lycium barbarum TaxID=112863 RepID=UPI00293E30F2|nr:acyl-CoA--sterol O-acyltransferase 1-like [Lycium barbarum]
MKGEIHIFFVVWTIVLACLCYSHTIAKFFPKGKSRFLAIIPIVFVFFILPLYLTSAHLGFVTFLFITWLANFKLLLFAFGKGPLVSTQPLPLSTFIPLACLPIEFQNSSTNDVQTTKKIRPKSTLNHVSKITLLAIMIRMYNYKDYLHPKIILSFYCLHFYFMLEILLNMIRTMVQAISRVELEPPFDEPYMSSSVQNFWGRRWNRRVSSILRLTIYNPVRSVAMNWIPRKWVSLPAVFTAFLVSGIMHELLFYYMGRLKPNGKVFGYFIIQGVTVTLEIVIKKLWNGKTWVPKIISVPLTLSFMLHTSFWLFLPPLLRGRADVNGWCTESLAFLEFIRYGKLVSPTNFTCPF